MGIVYFVSFSTSPEVWTSSVSFTITFKFKYHTQMRQVQINASGVTVRPVIGYPFSPLLLCLSGDRLPGYRPATVQLILTSSIIHTTTFKLKYFTQTRQVQINSLGVVYIDSSRQVQ